MGCIRQRTGTGGMYRADDWDGGMYRAEDWDGGCCWAMVALATPVCRGVAVVLVAERLRLWVVDGGDRGGGRW